ncbi:MAG: hypothetical protein ACI3W8_02540 [Oscillospiraceae bacterium]
MEYGRLSKYQRNVLLENNIAFIETDKQIYIPQLFLCLNERKSKKEYLPKDKITISTQIVLFYIYNQTDNVSLNECFNNLNVSKMTVSRAFECLENNNLINTKILHKNKLAIKKYSNLEMIEKYNSIFINPVKEVLYIDKTALNEINYIQSGISALAEKTLLSDDDIETIAVYEKDKTSNMKPFQTSNNDVKVEFWKYNPQFLGKKIDIFSLYASLKDNPDERVQIALEEYLKQLEEF